MKRKGESCSTMVKQSLVDGSFKMGRLSHNHAGVKGRQEAMTVAAEIKATAEHCHTMSAPNIVNAVIQRHVKAGGSTANLPSTKQLIETTQRIKKNLKFRSPDNVLIVPSEYGGSFVSDIQVCHDDD